VVNLPNPATISVESDCNEGVKIMKITVLGTGNVGGTLGKKWAAAGHNVTFGVRDVNAEKVQTLLAESDVQAASIAEAIAASDIIVFAIPGTAVAEIVTNNKTALNSKIIIDATNKIREAEMSSFAVFTEHTPQANLFRVFNSLGWEVFANPTFNGETADHFYCGDSGAAQDSVHQLITDIGLRPIYIGGRDQLGVVDNLVRLYFALALGQGYGRHVAFKTLHD
jgi:predicted dinucleotide-binding enzyme